MGQENHYNFPTVKSVVPHLGARPGPGGSWGRSAGGSGPCSHRPVMSRCNLAASTVEPGSLQVQKYSLWETELRNQKQHQTVVFILGLGITQYWVLPNLPIFVQSLKASLTLQGTPLHGVGMDMGRGKPCGSRHELLWQKTLCHHGGDLGRCGTAMSVLVSNEPQDEPAEPLLLNEHKR